MTFESPPIFESYSSTLQSQSYKFDGCRGEIEAATLEEVPSAIEAVEDAVASGLHAAGYLSYDAAPGIDPVLSAQQGTSFPLLCFGLFERRQPCVPGEQVVANRCSISPWKPSIPEAVYAESVGRIHEYIAAGDTYQVNYTFQMMADFDGDARALYRDLCRSQGAAYCAYLDFGRYQILSVSPELFFSLTDGVLTTRPMKGTRPRGRWLAEDRRFACELRDAAKDRAENLMIVDLLRNDLGRISATGSVAVEHLWQVEQYETVLQLTSTVRSNMREGTSLRELFSALFPCGSVTGAPKVRTMQIIAELESQPRGLYTGAIGFLSPSGTAQFSVAIRTVCVDRDQKQASFGVGGGITHDSEGRQEFQECAVKSRVLVTKRPEFSLLETMLYEPEYGYYLLDRHLERLEGSARYFGIKCDKAAVNERLRKEAQEFHDRRLIRLLQKTSGAIELESAPLDDGCAPVRARFAVRAVDEADVFLFHKTTHRNLYETRLADHPDYSEVLLWNSSGEVTEFCTGNIVAELDGEDWTPPVECGLLGGTFRAHLLESRAIKERVLVREEIERATRIHLINSVRKWVEVEFCHQPGGV